jgi:hypothetical protein
MTNLAEICVFLGDEDAARRLLALLAPYADRFVVKDRAMVCKGSVSRFLGLLAATAGRPDESLRQLRAALAVHQRIPAPPLVARTEFDVADVIATQHGVSDPRATEHARRGLALAETLGMTALAFQCQRLLVAGQR